MDILSIDIGTYSIKFVRGVLERRQIRFLDVREELLFDASKGFHPTMPLRERQIETIKTCGNENDAEKVIFQVPNWLLTSRYLTLPTNKQKQIAMMVPFQLEEKLPYSAAESHYISWIEKKKENSHVAISIVQKNDFQDYYNLLVQTETSPSILTSELFVMNCCLKNNPLTEPAAILDLGHETTKAYFVHNGMLVSNQTSCVAGKIVDEAIAQTYGISPEEASDYKHKNCFFLVSDQNGEITSEQKEFADLMEKIFTPLVQEYKRWELGYRINYGEKINTVYLMGGTGKIHNIENFLMEALEVNVEYFPQGGYLEKEEENFSLAKLMCLSQRGKYVLPNFLHGEYSGKASNDTFLQSTGFILSRTLVVSMVIIVFLLLERFVSINPAISRQDKINRKLFKDPQVTLNAREKRRYRKNPKKTLKKLRREYRDVQQEVSTILSSASINALSSLSLLSSYLDKDKDVELVEFKSDGKENMAVFKTKKKVALKKLGNQLKELALPYKKIQYQKDGMALTLTFGKKQ